MIQELLGGVMEERKMSINPGALFVAHGSSSAASSFSSSPSPSSVSSPSSSSEHQQNLRCPRCDSSNTKFCYYNNYNLTQPRHFCKTCRRYWTKGGALRNVPIGGGCRKAKPSPAASSGGRSGGGKSKPASPDCAARVSPGFGIDQELSASPILWSTPYSSHLLALLRASQFQNPNPNPNPPLTSSPNLNSLRIKEEVAMIGSAMVAEPTGVVLSDQSMSFDPLGQLAVGPSNSHWRSCGQFQYHQQQPQPPPPPPPQQQHSMLFGEMQSSGIQELYHRLRSSGDYHNEQLPAVMNNVGSAAACSSSIMTAAMSTSTATSALEPLPLTGGEFGYWNPACSWADLPTTNGAFP